MASRKEKPTLSSEDVREARDYIEHFWVNLERYSPKDNETLIGLPNPYLVPAHDANSSFNFDEMYYWDSYFIVQGMLHDPTKKTLIMGILENFFTLLSRFKMIPNASRTYLMGRSQPPLLTSFIFDVYEAYSLDTRWLAQAMEYAKIEYEVVWMGERKPFWHQVHKGLSRYFDVNMLHDLAEAESGWDMTTRFNRRCLDYLPIDLNAYLYKYETDFARTAHILGQLEDQVLWERQAAQRKETVDKLLWNEKKGLYFDYNFLTKKQSQVASLASYVPLWAGMADTHQIQALHGNLKKFQCDGGLVTTLPPSQTIQSDIPEQWAYPNGWAPLHFLVVRGLEQAQMAKDAKQIALSWLSTNLQQFNTHGIFFEKYNVVHPDQAPQEGVYPSQTGFGWTNAVFERFCQDYLDSQDDILKT